MEGKITGNNKKGGKMRKGKKKWEGGREKGVGGGEKTGRKEGWKEREERVGRRRREVEMGGKAEMQDKTYPCTSGSSIFILVPFLFPK